MWNAWLRHSCGELRDDIQELLKLKVIKISFSNFQLMPDCKYETTTVQFSIGEEKFAASCSKVLDAGFTRIFSWQAVEETALPEGALRPGAALALGERPALVEGQTGPPSYLTEAELITAMEKHGIGTDASIPVHIENICERGYVEVRRSAILSRKFCLLESGGHQVSFV